MTSYQTVQFVYVKKKKEKGRSLLIEAREARTGINNSSVFLGGGGQGQGREPKNPRKKGKRSRMPELDGSMKEGRTISS